MVRATTGDGNEVVVRGVTFNNIITLLTALGLAGGGGLAYKNWPDQAVAMQAIDQTARQQITEWKNDCGLSRQKIWESIGDLRESQKTTDVQLQVLTSAVGNLADNVQDYITTDRVEATRRETKMDKQDERLRELEMRRTP